MEQIRKFTEEFFRNLKCIVSWKGEILEVGDVPRGFEDLVGKAAPYSLSFVSGVKGTYEVCKGSLMLGAMMKFLEGSGKATLLRIDFEVDAEAEIKRRVGLKNCELMSLSKKYKNNFFSRFSFVTSFNYLNESERIVSDVYVYEGEVVDGDGLRVNSEQIKADYVIAKARAVDLVKGKQSEVSGVLKEKVEAEVSRIREHYDKALKELGGDLNGRLEKIQRLELALRSCDSEDRDVLKKRLVRFRSGLVKAGDDEVAKRVLKEREMTIRDAMHKFSLNVGRKLVNTTVIYYPVYTFRLCLNGGGNKKFVDVEYDPLTKKFGGLDCECCGKVLTRVNLCEGGHISCDECLDRCGECGGVFCRKCLGRSCGECGRKLCKGCVRMCLGCGGVVCATHLRRDGVSGEDRCVGCLRACLRCHGMSEERFFGEAIDGSKVCGKCLGREKSGKVLERVFR